jgi:hypothetical protein
MQLKVLKSKPTNRFPEKKKTHRIQDCPSRGKIAIESTLFIGELIKPQNIGGTILTILKYSNGIILDMPKCSVNSIVVIPDSWWFKLINYS